MMSEIEVFDMTSGDIPSLVAIENASFSSPWTAENFEDIDKDISHFLVAKKDGETVGYIGFYAVLDEGYTNNIAVLPRFRRQGVADALMRAALDRAEELSLAFLSLEVRKSNEAAIALYNKYGFETVGERKHFYSKPDEDALIMTRYFR